jgi:uncharacterized membrane protein
VRGWLDDFGEPLLVRNAEGKIIDTLLALLLITIVPFLILCLMAGAILVVLLKFGWVYRRWLAMTIATGLLIALPLYVFLLQYFQSRQCSQVDATMAYEICGDGLSGVLASLISMAMIALSFIVGPIMGSRLHRRWSKDGQ